MERGNHNRENDSRGEGLSGREKLRLYLQHKLRILSGDKSVIVETDPNNYRYAYTAVYSPELTEEYRQALNHQPYDKNRIGATRINQAQQNMEAVFEKLKTSHNAQISSYLDGFSDKNNFDFRMSVDIGDGMFSREDGLTTFAMEAEKKDPIIFKKALSEAKGK
jgi:hypothetical protein